MNVEQLIDEVKRRRDVRAAGSAFNAETESDIQSLLDAISTLQSVSHQLQNSLLNDSTSVQILLRDIRMREAAVQEREERVWGWRILVSDRDEILRVEVAAIETRERELKRGETELRNREIELVAREKAVDQKMLLMREDYLLQTKSMKLLLQRAEMKAGPS